MEISFFKGNNHSVRFKFKTFTGTIEKMFFTVKDHLGIVRIKKKLNEGIQHKDEYYIINFLPDDTENLSCNPMIYDIKIVVSGEKHTIAKNRFILEEIVTTSKEEV